MTFRKFSLLATLGLAILAVGQPAQAGFNNFVGTLPINVLGTVTTDTGNINTATVITLPGMGYTGGATGDFTNIPTPATIFSPPTPIATAATVISGLNPSAVGTAPISFSFSASGFGMFVATSYIVQLTGPLTQAYEFFGTYTTGSDFASDPNAGSGPASFTLNLTQSGSGGISASSIINVPPLVVPEPASAALLALGVVGVVGVARRRIAK